MPDLIEWIDPDGNVYPFDGSWNILAAWGIKGRFGPKYQYLEQSLSQEDGSILTAVTATTSSITLPWEAYFSSELQMRAWFDTALWAFDPQRGQGRLRAHRQDGSGVVREFPCTLRQGYEDLEEALSNGFNANAPKSIFVFTGGPYWEEPLVTLANISSATSSRSFFPTAIPLYLSSSSVWAAATVYNYGQKEAWPLIYVQGPGTVFSMTDPSTGENFGVNTTIPAGDAVQIDLRQPGNRRVYLASTGEDLMPLTTGDPFPLKPRVYTSLQIALGGTDANSRVSIQIEPKYSNP